jgi:hypothetical protein
MTARDTYNASVKTAAATQIATLIAAEATKQTTIDASNSVAGYNLQTGNYANFNAAMIAANKARWKATFDAEHAKQVAIGAARDLLRSTTTDRDPF